MKTTKIFVLFLIFSMSKFTQAQNWNETAKSLPIPHLRYLSNQQYGNSVAIDGNYAVIGAQNFEGSVGMAHVLFYDGINWVTLAYLQAFDGEVSDYFSCSVDISGDNIVIGSYNNDDNGSNSGSAYIFTKPVNGWADMTETAKILPSDGAFDDNFGSSVSISGDNIVIGAYNNDDNGANSGSAYIYTKPLTGWADMTETAKILPSDGGDDDRFGWSVDISGDDIVIGAYNDDDNGSNSGSVYIFTKPITGWVNMLETVKILPSDGTKGDKFGVSVSISGNNIVIGAFLDNDGLTSGSAYVFNKPVSGWVNASEVAKILPSDGANFDYFGYSVSISGDNIVVGSNNNDDNGANSGSAYVYTKPISGWVGMTETAKILPSDGAGGDFFGRSVSISGNNVVVGAMNNDDNGSNSGSVYIFAKPITGWVNMLETVKIIPLQFYSNNSDYYGSSIAVDGYYAIVGVKGGVDGGAAYVMFYDGTNWITQAKLTPSDGAVGAFGYSVSIFEDNVVVGAHHDNDNGSNSGSAYVFTKPTSGWTNMTETAKILPSDGAAGDYFGNSVSIFGDDVVVGAPYDDDNGNNSGSVYIFTKPLTGWTDMTETAVILGSDTGSGDGFGFSVNSSGDNVVVGAPFSNVNGNNSGSAYVFTKPINGWVSITDTAKILPSDGTGTDEFGWSVSISGENVIIGAHFNEGNGYNSGSAYLFTKPVSGWVSMTETFIITPSDGASDDGFGESVSISGNNVVVGAFADDDNGYNSGSAYLYVKYCLNTVGVDGQSVCDSYDWIDGNTYMSSNNSATYTITNFEGCDSIVTLDLTINSSTSGDTTVVACNAFDWYGTTYTTSGNPTHMLINTVGCDSVVTLNLTINNSNETITQTNGVNLMANQIGATYQWIDCDNFNLPIAGETNQTFVATEDGSYAVMITLNSCTETSSCILVSNSDIDERNNILQVNIYPNPATDQISINLNELPIKEYQLTIYSLTGVEILNQTITNKVTQINTNHLNSGVYFIKVNNSNSVSIERLVIE